MLAADAATTHDGQVYAMAHIRGGTDCGYAPPTSGRLHAPPSPATTVCASRLS